MVPHSMQHKMVTNVQSVHLGENTYIRRARECTGSEWMRLFETTFVAATHAACSTLHNHAKEPIQVL